MLFNKLFLLIFSLIFISTSIIAADNYVADKAHTNIGFTVKHMVVTTVLGKFKDYEIDFVFDEKDLSKSSVKATIKTASIFTDNEDRDNHLRSADFFDAGNYPEITFISNAIMKKSERYVAKGILTIRGISKEIELPFEILGPVNDPYGYTKLGIDASLKINRLDYGVNWNKTLDTGGVLVSNDVNIKLDVELTKVK